MISNKTPEVKRAYFCSLGATGRDGGEREAISQVTSDREDSGSFEQKENSFGFWDIRKDEGRGGSGCDLNGGMKAEQEHLSNRYVAVC